VVSAEEKDSERRKYGDRGRILRVSAERRRRRGSNQKGNLSVKKKVMGVIKGGAATNEEEETRKRDVLQGCLSKEKKADY